jgi:hypothetical protein
MRKIVAVLAIFATGCLADDLAPVPEFVLVGAGDIASCQSLGDEATASRLDEIDGTVFTLGDNAYFNGAAAEFRDCYAPTWGRHKWRTRPAPGNHEYETDSGGPYYDYFGELAGPHRKGYYSYEVGPWHVIVINSSLDVSAGSPQEQWLRQDLAAHPALCTVAYWHFPLFSSGNFAQENDMRPIWRALYEAGAEIVMSGHEHFYERFEPQTADGELDYENGIRQFTVGTGGYGHHRFGFIAPNSVVRDNTNYGLLKLTLYDGSYEWEFVPVRGERFFDHGTGVCH